MALYFSRDVTVYVKQSDGAIMWEIPVLDGYSFSQAVNSSEVALSEMTTSGGVSRRGRTMFNDSLGATEWSFSTYARPFASALSTSGWELTGEGMGTDDAVHSVEEALLANMVSAGIYDQATGGGWSKGITSAVTVTGSKVDFLDSDLPALGTFTLYFVFDKEPGDALNCVSGLFFVL